jgi:hypothetical protein
MNKQYIKQKSSQDTLRLAEQEMKDWYENELAPYKQQKHQEKLDFKEFAKVIINNTTEVKYMIANIYDSNFEKAVSTWNELKLEPVAQSIKLEDDMLVVIDDKNNELKVNFDKLLADISKVLGE